MLLLLTLLIAARSRTVAAAPADEKRTPTDDWYVIRYDDQPVGYERTTSRSASGPATPRGAGTTIQRRRETRLRIRRSGFDLSLTASLETTETRDGRLLSFSLRRTDAAGATLECSGVRDADTYKFVIDETVAASRRQHLLAVPHEVWSPVMTAWVADTLRTSTGRQVRPVLFPETAGVADVVVELGRTRVLKLADQQPVTLRLVQFHPASDPAQRTTFFIDDTGSVVIQEKPMLGGTIKLEKATAAEALTAVAGKSLDLDAAAIIPVDRVLRHDSSNKLRILELRTDNPLPVLVPDGTFQRVEVTGNRSVEITLLPVKRTATATQAVPKQRQPLPPTRWMPTQDALVQRLARDGAAGATDTMQLCLNLERFLHSKMRHSAFSTTTLPADEVARTLRGDCTEHAVLLAAMMRVHGVESRVVSGLISVNQGSGFVGHAWTEAKIGADWIPFDSTLKSADFVVPHIRLADSVLPDDLTSGVPLFLPVLGLTGRTKIRVLRE